MWEGPGQPISDSQLCLLASLDLKEAQRSWLRVWSTQAGQLIIESPQTMKFLWQEEWASAQEEGRTDRWPNARAQPQQFNVNCKPNILQVGYFSTGLLCAQECLSTCPLSSHHGDPGCAEGTIFLFHVCSSRHRLSCGHWAAHVSPLSCQPLMSGCFLSSISVSSLMYPLT